MFAEPSSYQTTMSATRDFRTPKFVWSGLVPEIFVHRSLSAFLLCLLPEIFVHRSLSDVFACLLTGIFVHRSFSAVFAGLVAEIFVHRSLSDVFVLSGARDFRTPKFVYCFCYVCYQSVILVHRSLSDVFACTVHDLILKRCLKLIFCYNIEKRRVLKRYLKLSRAFI